MPYNNKQDDDDEDEDEDDVDDDVDDEDDEDDEDEDDDDKAKKTGYYTYQGSLTTPPCYESVRWIVFKDIIKISNNQVSYFWKKRVNYAKKQHEPKRRICIRMVQTLHKNSTKFVI